ncbi:MAG: type II toxin-antitoxin system RelE/ParE family toxin [Flavobacterium sp.]|jgi:hypothetical protein|uniref:type II toxin-antitoxin system RelE/ParE family toxin n=1 Tax=Flavobacterium sp. TaxID=239 RepID=UPI0022C9AC2E|nr:type II toxin-antitoxin system RelE/ParE family toxin [Flavobacterium sp.]MCZ8090893.1 type II toxin-antitoxin system RelE/ParE family toxin [Flavobacterium sp.]MCZ8331058.1 type II toxin-antitoxin system RelE/ParE family toxin [Flavobacterium sp.]
MVYKVKFLKLAEIEINESFDFYESRSKGLGLQFLKYLKSYVTILVTKPELFEIKKQPFYRELPLKKFPFVIVYEIMADEVIIHSVFHTSRNPSKKP